MPDTDDFVAMLRTIVRQELRALEELPRVVYAQVDAGYTSGRPFLTFEGETALSGRSYAYLAGYSPTAGDRVAVLAASGSYLVLGAVL